TKPAEMVAAVQAAIWAADKDQPVWNLQPMEQVLSEAAAAPRIYMALLGTFAAIALVIASAGIYGLSAYAVVRRRQALGLPGAPRPSIPVSPSEATEALLWAGRAIGAR